MTHASQNPKSTHHPASGLPAEKDPAEWTTGNESMTGPQASYLQTLCQEAGETFDPDLTKAEASQLIDALQTRTGRGRGSLRKARAPFLKNKQKLLICGRGPISKSATAF